MKSSTNFWVLFFAMLIFLTLLQPGCKKENPEKPPETSDETVIPETTKIIEDQDWNENLIAIDSTNWKLTFNSGILLEYPLETGDIIISRVGYGLLRKVIEIKEESGKIIVSTTEGTVVEAIPKGSLEFEYNLVEQLKKAKDYVLPDGIKLTSVIRGGEDVMLLEFSLEKKLHEKVKISGELSFSGTISCAVGWDGSLDSVVMDVAMTQYLEIKVIADILSIDLKKEVLLFPPIPLPPIPVGPFNITPWLKFKVGANMKINSELTAGVYEQLDFTTGMKYLYGDLSSYCNMDKELGPIPPELSNTLTAKAYVKPQIDFMVYGVVSPYFAMQIYGQMDAELGSTPWWTLYAGLNGSAGFDVGLFGFTVVDISADLFDYKVPVANANTPVNNLPVADFTVDPESGGLGTKFQFDASGSSDEEDVVEDLVVRWDWENDGEWDTEYSTNKKASYTYSETGVFTVKLEVKDTEGAKDKTSNQVNVTGNTTPVAVFSVEPPSGAIGSVISFDYSGSHDEEDGVTYLVFRYDWEGDGIWDTDFEDYDYDEKTHIYDQSGEYQVKLQVKDTDGATADTSQLVQILNTHAPEASFTFAPQIGTTKTVFTFDASESSDEEDPTDNLEVRWGWSTSPGWDTEWLTEKTYQKQFTGEGTKTIKLEVRDNDGFTNITTRSLVVEKWEGEPCPGIPTLTYGGKVYNTLLIGDQCWLKENLDIGIMIPINSAQIDNGIIEKYCYEDDPNYCDVYGALYQWNEMMQYNETPGGQGLCPEGWHVATDGDWKVLEGTVDSLYGVGDPEWDNTGKRGYNAGLYLKSEDFWFNDWNGIDKYGFEALPSGYGNFVTGNFYDLGKQGNFWTSTKGETDQEAFRRQVSYNHNKIHRYHYMVNINRGYAVRCVKDE